MDTKWTELRPILPKVPESTPPLVRFDWAKQCPIDGLREKIFSCRMMLSEEQNKWWDNFITELETQ